MEEWILCPFFSCKTRVKIREDTELLKFPLFCPKCKHESLINLKQLNITVIKEPDAEPIAHKVFLRKLYIYRAEVKIFNWLYMGDNIHKNYFYDILFKKPWECQLPRF